MKKGDIFQLVTGYNYGDMKYENEGEHRILLPLATMVIHNIVQNKAIALCGRELLSMSMS